MELGNLLFGHSRGEYPMERHAGFETELFRLFEAYAPGRDKSWREYGVEFENDTFSVFPYYRGDCTCGYQDREDQWDEENKHAPECYQTALNAAGEKWLAEHPEPRVSSGSEKHRMWDADLLAAKEWAYDDLCAKFGLDRKFGCAVHCTCDYNARWRKFIEAEYHRPGCPIVKPNFLYKPTGFSIQWYKYPLRDGYSNQEISLRDFSKIIDQCIASLS